MATVSVMGPLPVPPVVERSTRRRSLAVQCQGPPAGVADGECLRGRVAAALGGREGDARGAGADGRAVPGPR